MSDATETGDARDGGPGSVQPQIFKAYDVRGLYGDEMDGDTAYLLGRAFARVLADLRGKPVAVYRNVAHHVSRLMRPTGSTWHVVTDMLTAMGGHSSLADLRRLLVPVWIVNGRRDVLRLEERRYLAARPGTRLTVVPGAGHDVNTHAPIVFNRILLDVLHELRHGHPDARPGRVRARVGAAR